ncbi:MAG: HAD-IIB family hydrolase [Oscillospiraceae bacterium]|nr:HAD-IIB family hydrolase [Oscillospiraceae bacterium]
MKPLVRISNLLLVSDYDGTMTNLASQIPQRNIEAVKRFICKGGQFTLATGRSVYNVRRLRELLPLYLPVIVLDGACVYDFINERVLYSNVIPDGIKDYIKDVLCANPHLGAMAISWNGLYDIGNYETTKKHRPQSVGNAIRVPVGELPDKLYKVGFIGSQDEIDSFQMYIGDKAPDGTDFIRTDLHFYEMIAAGQNKGEALKFLVSKMGMDMKNTLAIGDYHNDTQMLRLAGMSAATGDAPESVKAAADIVVCRCSDGSVADFIESIEKKIAKT